MPGFDGFECGKTICFDTRPFKPFLGLHKSLLTLVLRVCSVAAGAFALQSIDIVLSSKRSAALYARRRVRQRALSTSKSVQDDANVGVIVDTFVRIRLTENGKKPWARLEISASRHPDPFTENARPIKHQRHVREGKTVLSAQSRN